MILSARRETAADMADRKKKEKSRDRQTVQYHFFATEEESRKIEEKRAQSGIHNRCAYLRKMAIDGYCITMDLSDVREMVRLLGIYGNNLNQLARRANEGGSIYRQDIETLQKEMDEIWEMTRKILDRLSSLKT